MNRTSLFRLPCLRQGSSPRCLSEWTVLAEDWWPHDARELTLATQELSAIATLGAGQVDST